MFTWDKLYLNLKEYLDIKIDTGKKLWSLIHSPQLSLYRSTLLNLWRLEIHHAVMLNTLFQSLGYNQIKIIDKEKAAKPNIEKDLLEIITWKEAWLPKIEQIAAESLGNDIYFKLTIVLADEIVNIDLLKELQKSITTTPTANNK